VFLVHPKMAWMASSWTSAMAAAGSLQPCPNFRLVEVNHQPVHLFNFVFFCYSWWGKLIGCTLHRGRWGLVLRPVWCNGLSKNTTATSTSSSPNGGTTCHSFDEQTGLLKIFIITEPLGSVCLMFSESKGNPMCNFYAL